MGRSGTAQACLDNHMPYWTMLDTGLYYGFYQLRYVPRSLMPFDCFCGAAQSIMSLMMICLYDVCQKCRDLYGGSSQHSPCHGHTLTIPDQACPWQPVPPLSTIIQGQGGGSLYSPNNMSFSKLFALAHAALLKSGRFVSGSMILP
jgi:hypothetical protein